MVKLDDIRIRFGEEPLFDGLSWTITPERHRIGLVGPNGAGKTTLLKVIAGDQRVDAGTVTREGVSIGYLEQDVQDLPDDRTVREEALRGFGDVLALEEKEQQISEELETTNHESARHGKLLNKLHRVQEELNARESHRVRPRTEATLSGLGFAPDEFDRPLRTFSGGWRMRAALARLLLEQPDILLLDEPTNHLDIESISWVEETLRAYPGTVILVSHDRSALDRMVNSIAELVRGQLLHYDGNYSYYLEAREERYERWRREYENQQKRIKEIEEFISKFRYNASRASQVQSRIKKLEKMDRIPPPPDTAPTISFEFPDPPRSGAVVMELSQFSKTYETEAGPETVFEDAGPLTIERGDKIAVVGPNGAGKSTLARMLRGVETFDGDRSEGHNVEMSFYAQHHAAANGDGSQAATGLNPDQTVFEAVRDAAPDRPKTELRSLLGTFLFTDDDAFKKVRVLSGGEKSRLALARTLLSPANFLILDEPTNHLDIQSKEVLIEALQKYDGTFVLVSHDRYVLDAVAEQIWRVGGGTVRTFLGNYSDFRWQVEEGSARPLPGSAAAQAEPQQTDTSTNGQPSTADTDAPPSDTGSTQRRTEGPYADLNSYQLKRKLEDTENRILEIEERQEELERAMADPEAYGGDGAEARELSDEYNSLKQELSDLYEDWEVLTEHVMALED